jgi:3-phenylpropionate/trans-cinnamate dioxygenase ferredoxin reductase component
VLVTHTIAIVGAGQAGAQAAQSLRQAGYGGRLVLIGDEPHSPYQRPPLSKKYLSGEMTADRLALLPVQFFTDNSVECLFGVRVTELDAAGRRLKLSDGGTLTFDQALLTMGSRSRALPLPGADLEGVFSLRSIADVECIRPHVGPSRRIIIVGAGYIGMEVAAIARGLGLDVHMVEAAERVMARTAPVVVSRTFEELHRSRGVTFHLGAGVQAIERASGDELIVRTNDGSDAADCVLIGIGGQPNVELAQSAGLTVANGIAVDEFCRTSAPHIFAAGDCTQFPSGRYQRVVRLESVQNAIDQAKAAALSMLGKGTPYDPVPWFWSDQFDTKLQIAGLGQVADTHIVRGDPASGAYSVAHVMDGRMIALDAINQPRDYMQARRLVPTAVKVDETTLADPDRALTEALS